MTQHITWVRTRKRCEGYVERTLTQSWGDVSLIERYFGFLRASCTGTARVHFASTLHVCIWETLRWRCKKEKNNVAASCSIECRTAYISAIYANLTFGSFCDVIKTFVNNVLGLFTTCKTFADFCRLFADCLRLFETVWDFLRLFETCETFKATGRDFPFFSWGLLFTTIPRTKLLKTS